MSRFLRDIPRRATSPDGLLVISAIFVAIASAFSGEHPTGMAIWDPVLTALFTFVVCMAGSRSSWIAAAFVGAVGTLATGLVVPSVWTMVALVGTGLALASDAADQELRAILRTMATGVSMLAIYKIPPVRSFGVPSLIATIAVLPVLFEGWRASLGAPFRTSRWWTALPRVGLAVVALTGVSIIAAALFALPVPSAARQGLGDARNGDFAAAGESFKSVASGSRRISWALNGPWAWPARLVPVVSQHFQLAGAGASSAYRGSSAAAKTLTLVGNSSLQTPGGALNLDLINAIVPEGLRGTQAVDDLGAAINSPSTNWLVPPVRGLVNDARPTVYRAVLAADGAESLIGYLPPLLGSQKSMRYFVMFGTPAESRELGGLLGAYGVVELDQGKVNLVDAGDNGQLAAHIATTGNTFDDPEKYSRWYQATDVATYPQNLTSSPMLQEVASAVREVVPPIGGGDIDVVVYMDPFAIEAMVGLVGPIRIPGTAEPLTGENTARFLLVDQYSAFDDPEDREAFLVRMLEQVFSVLSSLELPSFGSLIETFQPLVEEKRIQMVTYDGAINGALEDARLLQKYPNPQLGSDFLAVSSHNGAPTKLDTWLKRKVAYDVTFDPGTGAYQGRATIDLTNEAPADLPDYMVDPPNFDGGLNGRNRMANRTIISIYTPHDLVASEVIGQPDAALVSWYEFGYQRHTATLDVERGETVRVTFDLKGSLDPGDYWLDVANQPLVNDDEVTISASAIEGWRLGDGAVSYAFTQTQDLTFTVPAFKD